MEIVIECLWHTDESSQKEGLAMETDLNDYTTRKVTFYSINAVASCKSFPEKDFTYVYSNGTTFIAPFPEKMVRAHIRSRSATPLSLKSISTS